MGKPAARISDMHTCPMVTPGLPPIPHVGGPITGPGCPTVLIGGMPAAVMGDMCVCVGPPDTIVLGSTGVMIGGKPAARMGDQCAHGGAIVVGCPTVLIGEVSPEAATMMAISNRAKDLFLKAKTVELKVTSDIVNAGQQNGGKIVGLVFNLKSQESLARKIEADGLNKPIRDSLRYTITFEKNEIANGASKTIKELENAGYKRNGDIKNTFRKDETYKGINTNFTTPDGLIIEVQFHTPESFNVKQNLNHSLYEEQRVLDPSDPKWVELDDQMAKNSDSIEIPPNIEKVK